MAKNFVALMSDLRQATNDAAKNDISTQISDFLDNFSRYSSSFIVSMMRIITNTNVEPRFTEVTKSDFYEYSIRAYRDDDDKIKFFLFVSFLQDYNDFEEELDERVLNIIIQEIKNRNFDLIVNHIAVNQIHYKDGSLIELIKPTS